MTELMSAVVKSVLSSDTIVLRGRLVVAGQLPKERVIHLEGLSAPRMGNRDRLDEPFAFEAREYLRVLLVGKEVKFTITNTIQTANGALEFGVVLAGGEIDVGLAVVKAGFAKVRDGAGKDAEEGGKTSQLREAQDEAQAAGKGVWGVSKQATVDYSMPEDPVAFLAEHKGVPVDAIIEAVSNGSSIRARLLLSPTHHQIINLGIAGVRAPRSGNAGGDSSQGEEFGDEARYFVESRLLQRQIKITLLSLPTPTVAPSSFNSTAAPSSPPSMFLATIDHPAGNIAALLVAAGLAKITDWHAGFLSLSPTPTMMADLRKAENEAKAARLRVWNSLPVVTPVAAAAQADRKFDAVVTRVWGTDMLSVVKIGEIAERKIQLASVRQIRVSDPKLAGLQVEGKELLRKKLIGKLVHVLIDYVKAADGEYEARECATVKTQNGGSVGELLVDRGLLSVIRHRQGEDRSSDYDSLLAREAKAMAEGKGMFDGKEHPIPRVIDASESAQKAAPFLSSFRRAGRTAAVVDFVASGSRFKVFVPKQDAKLTLVLSGIRAPRTARNPNEKSEPYGQQAADFISRRVLQRDVEILVESNDKSGGFIGKMFLGSDDVAVMLVREGLARVDDYSGSKELADAQEEAKRLGKNIWKDFDAAVQAAADSLQDNTQIAARREYVDCIVVDVRGGPEVPFSFAVQILTNGGIPALESLMSELTLHHKVDTPVIFVPRSNDLVSSKFTADNVWYRARVLRSNPAKKEAEVYYIDYGNSETVPFSRLRPLAPQFKVLESQAKEACLSFVNLLGSDTEYGAEAIDRFRELCEGMNLVANVDARDPKLLHLSLFDPANPSSTTAHEASINVELVREGLARIDTRSRFRSAYPSVVKALDEASRQAKRSRAGAYELGDIFDEE